MTDQGGMCPRCATPYEPRQGYCLECGMRLDADAPPAEQEAAPVAQPPRPTRTWIWAALGGLVVAAAGAAVAIAVSDNGNGTTLTMTTTVAPVVTATMPATDPGAIPPQPTTTVAVTTVATVPTVPEDTATTTTGEKPTLIVWPGKTAYTVVLTSLPSSPGGHAAALAGANQALAKGLPQVGVLDSGAFPSLNPGYYVVFSGVYKTLLQAETGARNARFQGFGSAYPRQIKR